MIFGRKKEKEVRRAFVPAVDITTFELATIVSKAITPALGGVIFPAESWVHLDPNLRRHFVPMRLGEKE